MSDDADFTETYAIAAHSWSKKFVSGSKTYALTGRFGIAAANNAMVAEADTSEGKSVWIDKDGAFYNADTIRTIVSIPVTFANGSVRLST